MARAARLCEVRVNHWPVAMLLGRCVSRALENHIPGCRESMMAYWQREAVPPHAHQSIETGGLSTIKIIITHQIFYQFKNCILLQMPDMYL